jgi:hypothetical protein
VRPNVWLKAAAVVGLYAGGTYKTTLIVIPNGLHCFVVVEYIRVWFTNVAAGRVTQLGASRVGHSITASRPN